MPLEVFSAKSWGVSMSEDNAEGDYNEEWVSQQFEEMMKKARELFE